MGVKDLMKVIKDTAPSAIFETSLSVFSGQKVAIDTSISSYRKFLELLPAYVEENEEEGEFWVVKWEPLRRRWLGAMLELATKFLKQDITPIFIFEDTSSEIKLDEHEKRKEKRHKLDENYQKLKKEFEELSGRFERSDRMERYKKAFINRINFDRSFEGSFFKILNVLGIPAFYSTEESDLLIAAMAKEKIISAAFSTDTDLIVYGVPYLLTNLFFQRVSVVKYSTFLEESSFTSEQVIDLAILLGTDYNQRVRGVGPVNAVRLLTNCKCLELLPHKYYTHNSRRNLVRKRFKVIPTVEETLRKSTEEVSFDADCQNILSEGSERLLPFKLSERWVNFLSSN